jgi:hypothetical protein
MFQILCPVIINILLALSMVAHTVISAGGRLGRRIIAQSHLGHIVRPCLKNRRLWTLDLGQIQQCCWTWVT